VKERYVVDTNVLIAASAADPNSPRDISATPEDPNLRLKIFEWLSNFQAGESRMVLDGAMKIYDEYEKKLDYGHFGILVVVTKWNKAQVDNVDVSYDLDENGVVPDSLENVIHDRADRKFVAAALASHSKFEEGCIAFAGDTDWHDWETALSDHQIILEPIIEEWSRAKHAEKAARG
jgi:hypothetical protein